MAADRPRAQRPDGTPAARRAPVLAALLAAGLLAGAPAPAASDPNGEQAGGGRDAADAVSP
ncbi:MAG: hypothetical protein AVDCRST_MAG13-2771, partial [uncultured Solirubrobacteraceae bacterium]